jgi:hypothetical protein
MKSSILGSFLVLVNVWAASAQEQQVVQRFSWTELKTAGQLRGGEVQPPSPAAREEELKIANPTGKSQVVTLLDLENPGVTSLRYGIEGSVRYEGVKGKSYLEMWSWFANGSFYFSRTLGDTGPMGHLEGSSAGRPFLLPFFSDEKIGLPTRLVVNVAFVGPGTVYLRDAKLYQLLDSSHPRWLSEGVAGLIAGVAGILAFLLGALIVVLCVLGRSRRFVLTATVALAGLGIVALIVGVIALAFQQPWGISVPPLLLGSAFLAVGAGSFPWLRRRYEQIELRKMAAMDAR